MYAGEPKQDEYGVMVHAATSFRLLQVPAMNHQPLEDDVPALTVLEEVVGAVHDTFSSLLEE